MLRIRMDSEAERPGFRADSNPGIARTVFIPGQRVAGKVTLDLEKDDEVSKVLIEFRGSIGTEIVTGVGNSRRHWRFNYTMFSFQKTLFDGQDFKLRATHYEWPFSFTFPERFHMRSNPFDRSYPGFTVGDQLLPPSCEERSSRMYGSISYELLARVPRTFLDWKSDIILKFTPVRLECLPHSMHVPRRQIEDDYRQKFRFDTVGPRSVTTKESLSDKFHSHTDTRIISFHAVMSAPTVVVVGKPYPLLVTLQYDSEEKVIPDFHIDHIEAHFKAYTQVRVDGIMNTHINDAETTIPLMTTKEGLGLSLPVNEQITVRSVFPPRDYAPPTFSTLSMLRTYRLTVHLKIRCLDDLYKVSCKWPAVLLLPSKMEEGVEEAGEMIRSGQFAVASAVPETITPEVPDIAEDVPPPTYKEAQAS